MSDILDNESSAPTADVTSPSDSAFDLASARPVSDLAKPTGGFDLSSARPFAASPTQQAQATVVANSEQSTGTALQAAGIARQLGVPQAAVETDVPRYQAQATAQQNTAAVASSPKLAQWVTDNPASARAAQGDLPGMATIENLLAAGWKGVAGFVSGQALGLNRAIAEGIANQAGYQPTPAEANSDWWVQNMIQPRAAAQSGFALPASATFGEKAANTVGNLLGMIGEVAATGGMSALPEAAGEVTSVAGAVGQQALHGARAMALPAITSAVNTGADVYAQTGNLDQARQAAQMSYLTTTLGGVIPLGVPGGLASRLVAGAVSGGATGEVSREAMNAVLPESMREGFDPQQAILSALVGAGLGGAMGPRALAEGVQQAHTDALAAETAERGGQTVEQIGKIAAASKLRDADPDAFHAFVASASEDSPLSSVYVDGQTLANALHQSAVDPAGIPELSDKLAEAVTTGGDVQIPVADYATHIAGTDLDKAILPELKTEEGGMTYAEGQKFYQDVADELQGRAQDILEQQGAADSSSTDVKAIGDRLTQQIQETGRYPLDVARASVVPVQEFYRTMADRLGVAPGDLYEQYPLRIGTGSLDPAARLGQEAPEGWGSVSTEAPESGPAYNPRGTYTPSTKTISLFEGADLTTLLHESGHFFLDSLAHMAGRDDAPQQVKDDMQTFLTWAGGKDLADWNSKTLGQQRDMHEKFARGFESYLMEGKAPTIEMQPLFSRFRSWLLNVYRNFTELHGAEPSDEMRGVFGRILASDTAIRQAEQQRGYFPLDLSKTGATDKQRADYAALGDEATQEAVSEMQARSVKDMQWMSRAKSNAIRELQRQHDALRDQVREQVAYEVMDQPINLARQFLKTGESVDPRTGERVNAEQGYKLNGADLKSLYADATYPPDLAKLRGLTAADGMHPDDVADLFGLLSGDELVRSLVDGEKPEKAIERLTDQRMLEQHGELTDPQSIEAAANAAVANQARARFMATGLKLLSNSGIPAVELARAANETAARMIAAKRVRDLNPRQYEVAEARANREAVAKAPTDPKAAIEAQRQALLSNRLARAARDAVTEVDKIVAAQKQYDKASIRAKMDLDVLEQIDALRERFDFRQNPPDGPTRDQVSLQTWVESQKSRGYVPVQNPDMMNPVVRMHYRDMTVEQIRGFSDTIRSMEQIARERKSVTIEGRKVDLAGAVDELVAKMKERGEKFSLDELVDGPRPGTDSMWSVGLDRMAAFLRASVAEFKPQQFKANQFDMHELGGPFAKTIFERVFDANYRKVDMLKSLSDEFRAAAAKLGDDWQQSLTSLVANRTLVDVDLSNEQGKTIYRRMTRGDMLGIARHVGNESNFDKITKGMGWEPRDVWAFLNGNMTEKDWQATQMTWDAFERHWPAMEEMNRRLGNVSPDHIQPRPFRTPGGTEMRGGYAPVDYDPNPNRSRRAGRTASAEAMNPGEGLFGREYFRADTTTNGSLNARTGYNDRIDLDFHSVERRLHDTVHDLAYREALIDVHKVLTDKGFRHQFQLTYGPEQYKSLNKWVGDLANGQNRDAVQSGLLRVAEMSRHALMRLGIAFRLSTVLKHGGSALAKSGSYFSGGGEKYFAARVRQIATDHAGQIAVAMEKFSEIRARAMQQDRDYRETTSSMFEPEGLQSRMDRAGHSFVAFGDLLSAVPTAWAAYDRAITEGIPENRGGTGKPMSEAGAVAYANQIVREAHGSNIESARSMLLQERNEAVKAVSMLYGFMNNSLGQTLDMADKVRMTGFSKPELFARVLGAIVVPALVSGALEEHRKAEGWAEWTAKAITGEVAGMVPLVRDVWSLAKGHDSAGVNPVMQLTGNVYRAGSDLVKMVHGEQPKSPIKDLGNAIGLAIPGAGQAGTSLQYLADVHSGKQQPKNPLDVARGVALGQGNQ